MKCTLNPAFDTISGSMKGRFGNRVVFMTRTNREGKKQTRVYFRSAGSYQRRTPVSDKEYAVRSLFAQRQAYVRELIQSGQCRSRAEAWEQAKIALPKND